MSDPNGTPMNQGMVKCGYCGNYHNYSAEMCKDLMNRPAPAAVENIKYPTGDTLAPLYLYTEAEVRERERKAFVEGVRAHPNGQPDDRWLKWAEAEALRRYKEA